MLWFKKKHTTETRLRQKERLVEVEVQHHQNRSSKVDAKAKQVTYNFNRLMNQNHITVRISSAAGRK